MSFSKIQLFDDICLSLSKPYVDANHEIMEEQLDHKNKFKRQYRRDWG